MITGRQLVDLALTQEGDRYIFGKEVKASETNPAAFDCSEFVEWIGARLGVVPTLPDGSWLQWQHCARFGGQVPIAFAITQPGTLLFKFTGDPNGPNRPASAHVAIVKGGGWTIEARSTQYGVGSFTADQNVRKWTHAAKIPGVVYTMEQTVDPGIPDDYAAEAWDWAIDNGLILSSHPRALATYQNVALILKRFRDLLGGN